MVDKSLVDELKGKMNAGAAAADADDILKSFDLIKQISEEVSYLKTDINESEYSCQMVFSDIEEEYWIKISKGVVDFAKGKIDAPSITITTSKDIGLGLFFGEVDANIVAPLGKLGVGGNFTDLRLFQELYEDVIDEFNKKY
ncbi:MAG: hypothetical protein ACTSPZ_04835 [Promethearchaeota archaeon]